MRETYSAHRCGSRRSCLFALGRLNVLITSSHRVAAFVGFFKFAFPSNISRRAGCWLRMCLSDKLGGYRMLSSSEA
ncbi:hypothetical protein BDU57DRAFT_516520 [Ampelomyces quisqualis]|uniref:Uncharacterized protein n=1 Tax=Ampelomyces quisqualis TaxID=50730 RepID=A0A6A5QLW5_AMPQU|nr:hypothetical protein BDU57DRAFT_516520 [Ampelomyces quisqualis]